MQRSSSSEETIDFWGPKLAHHFSKRHTADIFRYETLFRKKSLFFRIIKITSLLVQKKCSTLNIVLFLESKRAKWMEAIYQMKSQSNTSKIDAKILTLHILAWFCWLECFHEAHSRKYYSLWLSQTLLYHWIINKHKNDGLWLWFTIWPVDHSGNEKFHWFSFLVLISFV